MQNYGGFSRDHAEGFVFSVSDSDKEMPECPVGETECPRLNELEEARVEAAELAGLVHTDSLTGLFNYRHFELILGQELERTRRDGRSTALVMLDLDHFKRINDHWGHEAGNQVLQQCAEQIRNQLRKVDVACRYGGEEFALILPSTSLARAVSAARRIREGIAGMEIMYREEGIRVTASLGVDVYTKRDRLPLAAFVERADGFLYRAKEQGRNLVCHPDFDLYRPPGQVGRVEKEELFKS